MGWISRLKRSKSKAEIEFNRLISLLNECRSNEADWHERAIQALNKKREDLAREAIVFKLRAQKEAARIESDIAALGKPYLNKLRNLVQPSERNQTSGTEPWIQLEKIVQINKDLNI